MDLWIRSQDRKKLVKSGYLTLFLSDTNWFIYSDTTTGEPFEIGKYKTEERALEVLEEIQSLLQPKIIYHQEKPVETIQEGCYQLSQKVNMEFQELSIYVYEMPIE